MIKATLPTLYREVKDGKMIRKEGEREFNLDFSYNAQLRYSAKFPKQAEHEDLSNYAERLSKYRQERLEKKQSLTVPDVISELKLMYCCIITDETFEEFLSMFDFTDKDYMQKFTSQLGTIFDLISNGSVEKN